jgi:predicted helicase
VSINLFIKTGKKRKNSLGEVLNLDLYGKRELKYEQLNNNNLDSLEWNKLDCIAPNYYFVSKDFGGQESYEKGFSVDTLFPLNSVGIVTSRDAVLIALSKNELINQVESYYDISPDTSLIKQIDYRVFDKQFIYYDTKLIDRARDKVMRHTLHSNTVLNVSKQAIKGFNHIFVGNSPCDKNYIASAGQFGAGNAFPLYIYPESTEQKILEQTLKRIPNLNVDIVNQIAEQLGLVFTNEKEDTENTFAPLDLLDYIYASLNSPTYREKYKEFLKIDFPKIPYPKDKETFWQLVKLGGEIRQVHLLESPKVEDHITGYPIDGNNTITTKIAKKDWEITDKEKQLGRIWINTEQYFENIPLTAWEFYIGGYQPAQKWLKDRKERTLNFDDILHYQKIIVALSETDRLMKEIDKIEIE